MSRTDRVLDVLGLFTESVQSLSAPEIARALGVSTASAYRYLGDLEAAGLVEGAGAGRYVPGPGIVELDRRVRMADPLIGAAAPIMERLAERTGGVVLLCRLYGRKVLCVHQVIGPKGPPQVSYERGRAMPLFRGATSQAILAQLPRAVVEQLAVDEAAAIAEAGLPTDPAALIEHLRVLGAQRVCASSGEVDKEAMGWARALRDGRKVVGSLSVVLARAHGRGADTLVADQVWRAALRIEGRLSEQRAAPKQRRAG
ncbi:MAG: helix-turn-helix domain-containing protein [Burkholderiales bacterium]|nr:helix-turn-helix domain-containing protein [Burkholderiales bacterium]